MAFPVPRRHQLTANLIDFLAKDVIRKAKGQGREVKIPVDWCIEAYVVLRPLRWLPRLRRDTLGWSTCEAWWWR